MTQFSISPQTLFRVTVTVLSLWFLYLIRDIIALLLIAVIITAALNPVIGRLQKWHLPRALTVTFVYVLFFTMVSFLVAFIVPMLANQVDALSAQLSAYLEDAQTSTIGAFFGLENIASEDFFAGIRSTMSGSIGDVFSRTASFFTGVIATLATLSMSFYMSLQKNGMKRFLVSVTPRQHQRYISSLTDRIQESFGWWMAGQAVTMIFVGILYFIALSILGVPYALVLAVLGGILEIVPYLGPVMSAIPALILGFAISPVTGLLVMVAYAIINLIENHVLIPQIMQKAVGLNPVAVILALLIGAKVAGLIGVIIAVPIAGAVSLFIKDVLEKKLG